MKRTVSLLTAVFSFTLLTGVVRAQDQTWLRDRRYTEGIGIRVGDFELHPGVAAEFGYDSNYFLRSNKTTLVEPDEDPVSSLRLRITPSFSLSTLSPQRREVTPGAPPPAVDFRAGISATYNEFFPVSARNQASKDLMQQQRNVAGTLDMALTILPNRPWSGILTADVTRDVTPTNAGFTNQSFNRVVPRGGAELVWQPGGGLLDWRLGYQFQGVFFESSQFSGLTNLNNRVETRGRWRFLPRTALLYDGKFDFITYPSTHANAAGVGGKTGSHPMRSLIGFNGLITQSLAATALVGWGASFYEPRGQQDFDSVIGTAEIKWYLVPNPATQPGQATLSLSSIALGFQRDFFDSYIGTFFERDRGYLTFSYFFGGRFLLVADGGASAIRYPLITKDSIGASADVGPFTDVRLDGSLFGEYRFADQFGLNGTVRYGHNLSNTAIPFNVPNGSGGITAVQDPLQWQRFEAYIGVRWFM